MKLRKYLVIEKTTWVVTAVSKAEAEAFVRAGRPHSTHKFASQLKVKKIRRLKKK